MNAERVDGIRDALAAVATADGRGLDGLLVMSPHNRMYMTGFTGSSGYVLLTREKALLLTDFRYVAQAAAEAPCFEVIRHASPYRQTLATEVTAQGIGRLGFEAEHVPVAEHQRLVAAMPGVSLVPTEGMLERLRLVKDGDEIERIGAAVAVGVAAVFGVVGEDGRGRPQEGSDEKNAQVLHGRPPFGDMMCGLFGAGAVRSVMSGTSP